MAQLKARGYAEKYRRRGNRFTWWRWSSAAMRATWWRSRSSGAEPAARPRGRPAAERRRARAGVRRPEMRPHRCARSARPVLRASAEPIPIPRRAGSPRGLTGRFPPRPVRSGLRPRDCSAKGGRPFENGAWPFHRLPVEGAVSGSGEENGTMAKMRRAPTLPLLLVAAAVLAGSSPLPPRGRSSRTRTGWRHHRQPDLRRRHSRRRICPPGRDAFRGYVLDVLGFDPENLIDLRDATQAKLWSTFGSRTTAERSELWSYSRTRARTWWCLLRHGAPGLEDGRGYLLPVDADPNTAELNGYPIDLLYENLARLADARTARVYLDACFSGGAAGGGMLIEGASPVYVEASLPEAADERISVLTAASESSSRPGTRRPGTGSSPTTCSTPSTARGPDSNGRVTPAR